MTIGISPLQSKEITCGILPSYCDYHWCLWWYGPSLRSDARGRFDLVLTDVDQGRVDGLVETLLEEGYRVSAGVACDLSVAGEAQRLVDIARAVGGIRAVVHAAGLSPSMAPWEAILRVNVQATERLLVALEDDLDPGLAVVLIASMAGHMVRADADADAAMAVPLAADFLERARGALEPYVNASDPYGMSSPAYGYSKRAVIRMCEKRVGTWGKRGARIVSISPGTVWTPMGRREAQDNAAAAAVVQATPVGRWGTPQDIASTVDFLVSERAGFISGCDLRIDGGVTPVLLGG